MQHGAGNRTRFRTGEANHADAAATRRRSDGDDGVVEIHAHSLKLAIPDRDLGSSNLFECSVGMIIALQPGKMVFNPLVDVIDFTVEMSHFQLGLQVHFVIQVGF
jgi:hypothetical protein